MSDVIRAAARRTALAIAITAIGAHAAAAQVERRSLLGSSLAIYDLAGRVEVVPGTGSDVVVEITRGGRDAQRLSIEVGELRGRNALRVRYPDDDIVYPRLGDRSSSDFRVDRDGTWDDDDRGRGEHRVRITGSGRGTEAWADLRILVPPGKNLAVYVGVGELAATRVDAELTLRAAAARVTVNGTKGNLAASAGSGGLDVRGATGDEIGLATGSGGVTANDVSGKRVSISTGSGGANASGLTADDLVINSGSGTLRADDVRAPRARLHAGSGGIRAGFATPVTSLDVNTGSGGVTLTLPGPVNATLDIQTGSGGIASDFPVQVSRMDRNRLHGQIGDGSGRIQIRSGSGSVSIRKR